MSQSCVRLCGTQSLLSAPTLLQTFTAPTTGTYLFTVAGAQGGLRGGRIPTAGGLGAVVTAAVFLQAGATVPIVVARMGYSNPTQFATQAGQGGGGLSAVYTNGTTLPTVVAGVLAKCSLLIWPGRMSCDFSCKITLSECMCFRSRLFVTSFLHKRDPHLEQTSTVAMGSKPATGGGGGSSGAPATPGLPSTTCDALGTPPSGGLGAGSATAGSSGLGGAPQASRQQSLLSWMRLHLSWRSTCN